MKGGPSESADRSRFQTAVSCWRRKTAGGERYGKGAAFRSRHVGVRETSANELLMRHRNRSTDDIKTGRPPRSGKSIAVTYVLAIRCPVYRQRDFHLGFDTELENLIGGAKGKGTSGSPARPKVPRRQSGADCLGVVKKRSNIRGAKGAGHSRHGRLGQLATGGTEWLRRRAAALIEWHEPCKSRGLRTVLGEARGETPRAYSAAASNRCSYRVSYPETIVALCL
jgi:hypothetical protein